jgi:solute carrier family 25 (mitochondrial phosphate transporter), member 3
MSADKTIVSSATEKLQVIPVVPVATQVPSGVGLYARFAFAGAVCCAVTHGALTPGNEMCASFDRSWLDLSR